MTQLWTMVRRRVGRVFLVVGLGVLVVGVAVRSELLGASGGLTVFTVGGFYALRAGCAAWDRARERRRTRARAAVLGQLPGVDADLPRYPAITRAVDALAAGSRRWPEANPDPVPAIGATVPASSVPPRTPDPQGLAATGGRSVPAPSGAASILGSDAVGRPPERCVPAPARPDHPASGGDPALASLPVDWGALLQRRTS